MSPQMIIEATKDKVTETGEKVLGKARQTAEEAMEKVDNSSLFQRLFRANRNLTLAGLGALALVGDQLSDLSERCLERGEDVEQQAREMAREGYSKVKALVSKADKEQDVDAELEDVTEADSSAEVAPEEDAEELVEGDERS